MSLPLTARWEYYAQLGTEEGSRESQLLQVLSTSHARRPRSRVAILSMGVYMDTDSLVAPPVFTL